MKVILLSKIIKLRGLQQFQGTKSLSAHFKLSVRRILQELSLHELNRLILRPEAPFELSVFHGLQNGLESRPSLEPESHKIIPGQQTGRTDLLGRSFRQELANVLPVPQHPVAGLAIQAVKFQMLIKPWQPDKALQRSRPHLHDILKA